MGMSNAAREMVGLEFARGSSDEEAGVAISAHVAMPRQTAYRMCSRHAKSGRVRGFDTSKF